jgi:GNAT superfamily N-acetyltransferase
MPNSPTPSTESRIQVATVDQADAIVDLVNGAYRGDAGQYGWTTEAHLLEGLRTDSTRVRDLIVVPGNVVLVKVSGETIDGCVHLEKKDATTAYLGMLTSNVRAQAKGTGSALLNAAEEYAKRVWQTSKIEMTVIDSRHELIAYYVRRGYRMTEEKRPFPNDPRFGVSLVGPLEFVVLEKPI